MKKSALIVVLGLTGVANAQFAISLGIRETGSTGAIGSNGGAVGGIEWVNLDGQTLNMDGTWQTFTFNFQNDALTPFAGTSANGIYDGTKGVLEHIRIRNVGGITSNQTIWIDGITNNTATGSTVFGDFEGYANNQEVMFQEPNFSGSTSANLVAGGTAGVDNSVADTGLASYRVNFQFVDNTPTRWIRLTTFSTPTLANPVIDFANGSSLTLRIKGGEAVPEPATMTILGLGVAAWLRKKKNSS